MDTQLRRLRRQVMLLWCALAVTLLTAAAGHLHPLNLADANNQPASPVSLAGANWTGTLDPARLPAYVSSVNGQTGAVTGAQAVAGTDIAPGNVTATTLFGAGAYGQLNLGSAAITVNAYGDLRVGQSLGVEGPIQGMDLSAFGSLVVGGSSSLDGNNILTDGSGNAIFNGTISVGSSVIQMANGGSIATANGGSIDTSDDGTGAPGGAISTGAGGGAVTTNNGGGGIDTSYGGGFIVTNSGGGYLVTNGYGAPTDSSAPQGSLYCDQDPSGASGHVLWVMEPSGWVGK